MRTLDESTLSTQHTILYNITKMDKQHLSTTRCTHAHITTNIRICIYVYMHSTCIMKDGWASISLVGDQDVRKKSTFLLIVCTLWSFQNYLYKIGKSTWQHSIGIRDEKMLKQILE